MNSVDVALLLILVAFALRGYWRGFFRESFGVLAMIAGVAAALQFTTWGVGMVQDRVPVPPAWQTGMMFVGIFMVVHAVVSLIGVVIDWFAGASRLWGINRFGGALLGVAKGSGILAVVLLFLHLFPVVPTADSHIMGSAVARPLVEVASDLLRLGVRGAQVGAPSRT